jgi:hypothetical protein
VLFAHVAGPRLTGYASCFLKKAIVLSHDSLAAASW